MRLPLDPPFSAAWDPVPRRHFDATLVRVETDEGVTGYGSGDTMDGFAAFEDLFIGRDPLPDRPPRADDRDDQLPRRAATGRWRPRCGTSSARSPGCRCPCCSAGPASAPGVRVVRRAEEPGRAGRGRAGRAGGGLPGGEDPDRPGRRRRGAGRGPGHPPGGRRRHRHHGRPQPGVADGRRHLARPRRGRRPAAGRRAGRARRAVAGGAAARRRPGRACGCSGSRPGSGSRAARWPAPRPSCSTPWPRARWTWCSPTSCSRWACSGPGRVAELALLRHRWFTPHTWTNGLGLLANLHVAAGVGGGPTWSSPTTRPAGPSSGRDFFLAEPLRIDSGGCLRRARPARASASAIDEAAVAPLGVGLRWQRRQYRRSGDRDLPASPAWSDHEGRFRRPRPHGRTR